MTYSKFRVVAGAALILAAAQVGAAEKQTVSAAVGKPLQEAQKALEAKDYGAAQKALAEAAGAGKLSPYEAYVVARLKAAAAVGQGDYKSAALAYETVLASSALPPEDKMSTLEGYVKLVYASKDYAKTADAVQKYRAAGGNNGEVLGLLPQALYLAGKYKEAGVELTKVVTDMERAGKQPSAVQLQLLASIALKQNDMVGYTAALERIVAATPKKEYWLDLIIRTAQKPGFSDRLTLDTYRIRRATGTLERANDFSEAAQLALQAGFPGEAKSFVDEGYQKGLLGAGGDASRHQRLKDLVNKKITEDKATLAEGEKAAAAQATGDALIATGFNLVAYGDAKGLSLMENGIKKGGMKYPEHAKLHLGYAQLLAGKKDAAVKTFASIKGTDGARDLGRLWTLQSRSGASVAVKAQ